MSRDRLFASSASSSAKRLKIIISLGVLLDTDITQAMAKYCQALGVNPEVLLPIYKNAATQALIGDYKQGKISTPDFFEQLKKIIADSGISIAAAETHDPAWAQQAWNAETELNQGRLAELRQLAEVAEIYIYSDTNPAHIEKIGGVSTLTTNASGAIIIPGNRIYLSYKLGHLGSYQAAFADAFKEHASDKPVVLVTGESIPPHETEEEKRRREAMLAEAVATADGKDAAVLVSWPKGTDLAHRISDALPGLADIIMPSLSAGAPHP